MFFVLVCFEDNVKITLQIKTGTINLWQSVEINVPKYVFVAGQVVSQYLVVVLVLVLKISYYFEHFWLQHVFTITKSFFPCKYACKIFEACIPSIAFRSYHACFCLSIFYPERMDFDTWSQASIHEK